MTRIEVFDPPNCCPTGVCGPEVDPVLPRVAGDLAWLGRCGVHVARFNLAQQPEAFAGNPVVLKAMKDGDGALPWFSSRGVWFAEADTRRARSSPLGRASMPLAVRRGRFSRR